MKQSEYITMASINPVAIKRSRGSACISCFSFDLFLYSTSLPENIQSWLHISVSYFSTFPNRYITQINFNYTSGIGYNSNSYRIPLVLTTYQSFQFSPRDKDEKENKNSSDPLFVLSMNRDCRGILGYHY